MQERHFCDARHTETCSININHCCGYYFYSSGTRSSQVSRQPAWLSLPPPLQPHSTTFPLPLTQIQLFSTSVLLLFEARSFFTVETALCIRWWQGASPLLVGPWRCLCYCSPTHPPWDQPHLTSSPNSEVIPRVAAYPSAQSRAYTTGALKSSLGFNTMRTIQKDDWDLPGIKRKVNDEKNVEEYTPKY